MATATCAKPFGLVADVGGTNTRLAWVNQDGLVTETTRVCANDDAAGFLDLARGFLNGNDAPSDVVVAVAGPVDGTSARLTNRDWDFDTSHIARALGARRVTLINDLEALGQAVPSMPPMAVMPLHAGAKLGLPGQAVVVGLGTGFNVSAVDTRTGSTFSAELGHASLPACVMAYLQNELQDTSAFGSVERLFSGVGLVNMAHVLGFETKSAKDVAQSTDPRAKRALDLVTDAFGLMVREIAYMYFPRAGLFFNGSLARTVLSEERRARVLAPLRADTGFGGQFARLPAFLIKSDTVALNGCAARLLSALKHDDG